MTDRTRSSSSSIRRGRLRKATEFLDAAKLLEDEMTDASVTLLVNAGIAAADVICGARLGEYSVGENHNSAVGLLGQAEPGIEKYLRILLTLKNKVAYTDQPASRDELKKSMRAAESLVEAARRVEAGAGSARVGDEPER